MSDDLEEIEGVARTGGNLRIQISKALNVGAGKRGGLSKIEGLEEIRDPGKIGGLERTEDPEKRGEGPLRGVKNLDLGASSLRSALRKFQI